MKRVVIILLAAVLAVGMLAGCAGQDGATGWGAYSAEEIRKLRDLQFDGYRKMTVAEFQDRVWRMTDTAEYRALLERVAQDETLYDLRSSDRDAAFFFYVLEPLTAERWQSRTYSAEAVSEVSLLKDRATLEYDYTLTIRDARKVPVKDYCDMREGIEDAMQFILRNWSTAELRDAAFMQTEIGAYVDTLCRDMQTPEVGVEIGFRYFPLSAEEESTGREIDSGAEARRYPNGTEEDYRSLLALKTPGYEELPLAKFNSALLDWANENYERMERIGEDTATGDFPVPLSDEELSFVRLTVFLSGMENGRQIQSNYTGREAEDPAYDETLPAKIAEENGRAAWCCLFYRFSYRVSDAERVTVGERDRQVAGMIEAVRAFWDGTDLESLLNMSEDEVTTALEQIARAQSSGNITITTGRDQIYFERMDERGIDGRKSD